MNKNKLSAIAIYFVFASLLFSQVEFNGSVDFEVDYAGEDSKFITNEIVGEFRRPHLGISQLNLFAFAPITEEFSFNARIQWDTWGSGKLNPARITLAMLTYESSESPLSFTIGRFISPFGLYPKRNLASDNLFAHAPLAYGYFINISEIKGFWPKAGDEGIYLSADVGLTTLYFGGYNTGAMLSWIVVPEVFNIDIAITNAAMTSQADYTNLFNGGGVIRLGFQPVIYWQQGISAAIGSFMQKEADNFGQDGLEKFRQLVFGTDIILAHSYFELSGEFIYSFWTVPGFANGAFKENAAGDLGKFELENYSGYADFKIEPPFFTGSYIAFRYDILRFPEYTHPATSSIIALNPWDYNISRYSVAIGYKLARSVLLKLTYTDQESDNPNLGNKDYTFRGILTISF